jgi:DNA-binding transcriptional LysR family regulator
VSGSDEITAPRRGTLNDEERATASSSVSEHWVGLELRHFAALQAIAEEGSFKGAAARLGYTPSAISQQIANLERIVGARVIVREHGRTALGLTEAGNVLLSHTTAIDARLSAARLDLEALTRGVAGTLRVGVWESVAARILPELMCRFLDAFPDFRIDVRDAADDLVILRSLERGLLDVGFAVLPLPPGPFKATLVLQDPWVLVARAGSEEAARSQPDSLASGALPLMCYRSARALEPAIRQLRREGIELDIVLRSDYNVVLQELAATGLGVALMPRLAVDTNDERTTVIDVSGLVPPREIAIAWHSDRPAAKAVTAFVSFAAEVGGSVGASSRADDWWCPEQEDRPAA